MSTAPPPTVNPPPSSTTPVTATMPTLGAVVGSVAGSVLADKIGFTDPVMAGTVLTGITAVVTALFHWLGSKLGQPNW